jgi:hypothetical protein
MTGDQVLRATHAAASHCDAFVTSTDICSILQYQNVAPLFFFFTHDGQIKSRDVLGAASCHGFQNAAPSLSARCTYCIHTIRCCWNMHRNYSFRFGRARFPTTRSGDPPAAASASSSRILHLQYLPRGGRPSDPWGYSDAGVVYCSQAFHEPMPRVLVMTSLPLILALERNTHP